MEPKSFYVGIKGVIVQETKALILRKTDQTGRDFWDIPGGRIGEGEEIAQTLERELQEEVPSIEDISIDKLLTIYKLPRNLKDGNGLILVMYEVHAKLERVEISDEHIGYSWISKEEVESISEESEPYMSSGIREAILVALSKEKHYE